MCPIQTTNTDILQKQKLLLILMRPIGAHGFWEGTPFWFFIAFLLTSIAKILEGGYTFIPLSPLIPKCVPNDFLNLMSVVAPLLTVSVISLQWSQSDHIKWVPL
jgi:hypothetical protein